MTAAPRVLLCRLFERTSQKGRRYFTGRLGSAKVIAFEVTDVPEDQRYGADAVWNVYFQAPEDDRDQRPRQQVLPPPTRGDRTRALPVVGETRVHREQRADTGQHDVDDPQCPLDDEVPF